MMVTLTPNAVADLYNNNFADGFQPWLQVIDTKKIRPSSGGGADRYRIVLSDGTNYVSGMLATQLSKLMETEELKLNSIIQLKDFIGNQVQGRKIIIVLGIDNIVPSTERIGNPQNIEGSKGKTGQPTTAVPATATSAPSIPTTKVKPAEQENKPAINAGVKSTSFYGAQPVQQQHNPYKQALSTNQTSNYQQNRGPIAREDPGIRLSDINSLNPYPGGRWTIKARVTSRSSIRHWSNARGEGKLFSVDLLDGKGGEIRGTFFKESVDKFYDLLQPGGIFYFSGGKIKMANRKFTSIDNDYEITFDQSSDIRAAPDDSSIQSINYNFKKIADIESISTDATIDLLGIVKVVGDVNELTSKAGKQLYKRDLFLMDDSNAEIKVTMWNERAKEDCSAWSENVLALKGCRVSEFNGRSIGTFSSTVFTINPDIPQAGALLNWYNGGGKQQTVKSLSASSGFGGGGMGTFSDRLFISDIKDQQLGFGQKPNYITVKACVNFIKHDNGAWYQACTKCQKKVVQDVNQNFMCEKCQMTYETCENRYIMSITINDHTGSTWATCFNDQGKKIMNGKTADELAEIQVTNSSAYEQCFKDSLFKDFLFRLRIKAEQVQEELRVKASVVNLEPLDYVRESADLLTAISQYN